LWGGLLLWIYLYENSRTNLTTVIIYFLPAKVLIFQHYINNIQSKQQQITEHYTLHSTNLFLLAQILIKRVPAASKLIKESAYLLEKVTLVSLFCLFYELQSSSFPDTCQIYTWSVEKSVDFTLVVKSLTKKCGK